MDRVELKSKAKASLQGKYGEAIKMIIIFFLINFAVGFVFGLIGGILEANENVLSTISSVISVIVSALFVLGMNSFFLKISRNENVDYHELFSKTNMFALALTIIILSSIFITLWSLLLIIPGIIASISYSQVYFVAIDNPEMSAKECIDESKRLMDGHKMDYFVLQLSFIGWMLLGIFTIGILYFWLMPYMSVTNANFYNSLVNKK